MPEWPEWLKEILSEPTTSVPQAGRALGIKGRNTSYAAARRGDIKTIKLGKTMRVPTSWLKRVLDLND